MSAMEEFDALVETLNASAELIREQLKGHSKDGKQDSTSLVLATGDIKRARSSMFETMTILQQLLTGPVDFWQQMTINYQHLSCLRWLLHFNISSHVPLNKSISYASLSAAANVPEPQLRHVVGMAMTSGLFREAERDMLAHTPLSEHFVTNPLYLQTLLFLTETSLPTAIKMAEMTSQFNGSEKPNQTAHNIAMNTEVPFFPYLSQNPIVAGRLQAAMMTLGDAEETHTRHLIESFDWAALEEAHVVDVGGSTGHASIALAQAFPNLTFTVQDLPMVMAKASSASLPADLSRRISFVAHDFFTPQPPTSSTADIFLVRLIVQNHPRTFAQAILRNIASVMKPSARILLNNHLLPEPGSVGVRKEALERARDLFMLQAMNGADRDEAGFKDLVEGAGCGLRVREVRKGTGALGLIVVERVGGSKEGEVADAT